jgi:hypothetical protein
MPKYCTFCCESNTPADNEHLIPKWMARLYSESTWAVENTLTKYVRKGYKYVPLTVPWCKPCNGGWMHDLEDAARPILIPMIEGQHTLLSPTDQELIKAWFCLRAMVHDVDAEKRAPRPRYFKDEEHHQLAATKTCDPYYRFYVGKYTGSEPGLLRENHFDTSFFRRGQNRYEGPVTRGYSMTLVFKHLVLQVMCAKSDEPFDFALRDIRTFCFEFGEPFGITFPPPFRFSDKTIEDFAQRRPVEM